MFGSEVAANQDVKKRVVAIKMNHTMDDRFVRQDGGENLDIRFQGDLGFISCSCDELGNVTSISIDKCISTMLDSLRGSYFLREDGWHYQCDEYNKVLPLNYIRPEYEE